VQLRQGFRQTLPAWKTEQHHGGVFDMPGSSDSNSGMRKEKIRSDMRHFALDFSIKQSVHGGQSQALSIR